MLSLGEQDARGVEILQPAREIIFKIVNSGCGATRSHSRVTKAAGRVAENRQRLRRAASGLEQYPPILSIEGADA